MGRPFKCPYCESTDTVGKGHRKTKTLGPRSIRRCKACKRKFTPKNQKPADERALQPPQQATEVGPSNEPTT